MPFDWAGVATINVALASLAYGFSQINSSALITNLPSLAVWTLLLLPLIFLPLLGGMEKRAADPLLRPGLFTNQQVGLASLFSAGADLGEASLIFLPGLAVATLGVSKSTASFMLLPVVLARGARTSGWNKLRKISSRVVVQGGLLFRLRDLFCY